MNWYLEVLKKFAVFSGRARRKEFWMFALVNFLISLAITLVGNWHERTACRRPLISPNQNIREVCLDDIG